MYNNQPCSVKWDNKQSDYFKISNSVKQGGVICPLLYSCYINNLFTQLQHSGLGYHVGCSFFHRVDRSRTTRQIVWPIGQT